MEGSRGPQVERSSRIKKLLRGEFGTGLEKDLDRTFPIWRSIVSKIRVKSKVLSRKHVLTSHPSVSEMNDTQWVFELHNMIMEEERRNEEVLVMTNAARKFFVNALGLNVRPVLDENTGLLRHAEDHEIMPLSIMICRDEILKDIVEKMEEMNIQEEVKEGGGEPGISTDMTSEELDEFMGDIEFDTEELKKKAVMNSKETEFLYKNVIKIMDDDGNPEPAGMKMNIDGIEDDGRKKDQGKRKIIIEPV